MIIAHYTLHSITIPFKFNLELENKISNKNFKDTKITEKIISTPWLANNSNFNQVPQDLHLNMTSTPINSSLFNNESETILGKKESNQSIVIESRLVSILKRIVKEDPSAPKRSVFKFENNIKAASHNEKI